MTERSPGAQQRDGVSERNPADSTQSDPDRHARQLPVQGTAVNQRSSTSEIDYLQVIVAPGERPQIHQYRTNTRWLRKKIVETGEDERRVDEGEAGLVSCFARTLRAG